MAGVSGMGRPGALVTPQKKEQNITEAISSAIPKATAQPAQPSIDDLWAQSEAEAATPSIDDLWAQAETEAMADAPIEQDERDLLKQAGDVAADVVMNAPIIGGIAKSLTGYENRAFTPDVMARLRASFGRTDKEVQESLEKSYGKGNVKKVKDEFLFKKDGKWRRIDSENIEIIGDIADVGRDIIEGLATEGGTALGVLTAAKAGLMTSGAGLAAAPAIVAGARAGGAITGQAIGDLVQKVLEIPRDEERSAAKEYGFGVATNIIGGKIGDVASSFLAQRAAKKAAEKLKPPEEVYSSAIREAQEFSDTLKNLGLIQNVPGYDSPLFLHQILKDDPRAYALARKVADTPEYEQAYALQKQNFQEGFDNYVQSLTKKAGYDVGDDFKKMAQAQRKFEGEEIGKIRDQLIAEVGEFNDVPVKKLKDGMNKFLDEMGFSVAPDGTRVKPPPKEFFLERGYDEKEINNMLNIVNNINEDLVNKGGRLTPRELIGTYQRLSGITNTLYSSGTMKTVSQVNYARNINTLKKLFRDEIADKVDVIMPDTQYSKSMKRYAEQSEALEILSGALDNPDIVSTKALIGAVFDNKAMSRTRIAALKTLTQDRPEVYDAMVGSWISNAFEQANKDPQKMYKLLTKDPEVVRDVMGEGGDKVLKAFSSMAERLKDTNVESLTKADQRKLVRDAILIADNRSFATAEVFTKLLGEVDPEKVLPQILNKEGIDNFIKAAPEKSKKKLRMVFEGLVSRAAEVSSEPFAKRSTIQAVGNQLKYPEEKEE